MEADYSVPMTDFASDPIVNVIHRGIKRDIDIALDNGSLRAALILLYAGIDTMAALSMPQGQPSVKRSDFVSWAERYIKFPCSEQLSGQDLYGARCSVLHTYTVNSDLSRAGVCRPVGYMDKAIPEVAYNPAIDKSIVMVSVQALRDAFFGGVDSFLVDSFADPQKAPLLEERLRKLLHELPFSGNAEPGTAATKPESDM